MSEENKHLMFNWIDCFWTAWICFSFLITKSFNFSFKGLILVLRKGAPRFDGLIVTFMLINHRCVLLETFVCELQVINS